MTAFLVFKKTDITILTQKGSRHLFCETLPVRKIIRNFFDYWFKYWKLIVLMVPRGGTVSIVWRLSPPVLDSSFCLSFLALKVQVQTLI